MGPIASRVTWLRDGLFTLAGQVSKFHSWFWVHRNAANIDSDLRVQQVSSAEVCVLVCVRWCAFEPWGVCCCCSWSCCSSNRPAASWTFWSKMPRWVKPPDWRVLLTPKSQNPPEFLFFHSVFRDISTHCLKLWFISHLFRLQPFVCFKTISFIQITCDQITCDQVLYLD